jgi:hypothetical protein
MKALGKLSHPAISFGALVLAGLALGAGAVVGQTQAPIATDFEQANAASQALAAGRYLEAFDRLQGALPTGEPDRNGPVFNIWWQTQTFITGRPDQRFLSEVGPPPALDNEQVEALRNSRPGDAIATIVERARSTSIVILNEAHHNSSHRAFALEVARALRPLGYSILAAEAFANVSDATESARAMAELARDGYPRLRTGHYTKDPAFGDFVRQSLRLGYRPVAYERVRQPGSPTPQDPVAAREQAQAENLMARIFASHPSAKVLIYVGGSHAAEAPLVGAGGDWMALRLKRMTGIDPLTIDQTTLSDSSEWRAARAYYRLVSGKARTRPVILFTGATPLVHGLYRGAVDLQVVHPRTRLVKGRPAWLLAMGRRAAAIPRYLRPVAGRRLVQAFVASESTDAIPVDQVLVEAGKPMPPLMLPRVPVRYSFQDPAAAAR